MAIPNPPTAWVHTWLEPLYRWLTTNVVASVGFTQSYVGPRPTPASTGATATNRVVMVNPTTNALESTDGTNWYDAEGNIT